MISVFEWPLPILRGLFLFYNSWRRVACFSLLASALATNAADIYWTNTAGGNWNVAANWSSGAVPGANDNAFVISNGTYMVTLNVNATVKTLTVGATSGTQTLSNSANNLTVSSAGVFGINGVLSFGAGILSGTNTIQGAFNWTGGTVSGTLTVSSNATLNMSGAATKTVNGALTNLGTTTWSGSGQLTLANGTFYNQSGALFDIQTDVTLGRSGGEIFFNVGTFRKSAGTGVGSITPNFVNTGAVQAQTGTLIFGAGTLDGTFTADAGATINFNDGGSARTFTLDMMPNFSGAGTIQFISGFIKFTVPITNFQLAGATLAGTNVVIGTLNWTGGTISGVMTVSNTATLNISGAATKTVNGSLTNLCTTTWSGAGQLTLANGTFYNQLGALFDIQNDVTMSRAGGEIFFNAGTFRKSAGTGVSSITPNFVNSGAVQAQSGTLVFGAGTLDGTFTADAGATINFNDGGGARTFTLDMMPNFSGAGTIQFLSGLIKFTVPITDFQLAGGTLSGTNVVTGVLHWTGGTISGVLTVATNATLDISGAAVKNVNGSLTNLGTTTWTGNGSLTLGNGTFYNQPGALFDIQSNAILGRVGGEIFFNAGTFRKSAGGGTNSITPLFNNTGAVEVLSGGLTFGSGVLDGPFTAAAGTTINFDDAGGARTFTLDMMPNFSGAGLIQFISGLIKFTVPITNFQLSAGTLSGTNLVTGVLHWIGGTISGVLTVATNATLDISGAAVKNVNGSLTNLGTTTWTGNGSLTLGNGTFYNQPGALFDIQSNATMGRVGGEIFFNAGTFRKSAGGGTNSITPNFINTGLVQVQSGGLLFGAGTLDGAFTTAAGTAINFNDGGGARTFTLDMMPNFSVAGTIQFQSGLIKITVPITDFQFGGGTLLGTNVVTGVLHWSGGTIGGVLTVASNATLDISGAATKTVNTSITNYGTVTWSGSGEIFIVNATFYNEPGALFDVQGNGLLTRSGPETFFNEGTFRKSVGGTNVIDLTFNNAGTIEMQSSALSFVRTLNLMPTSVLQFLISGRSPGIQFGKIIVSTALKVDGTMNIGFTNAFVPVPGDVFQVITWPSQSGGFTQINGLDLGGGLYLQAICDAAAMNLFTRTSVLSPPIPATNLVNQSVGAGRNAIFCLTPLGAEPFTYQWSFMGTNLVGETNGCLLINNTTTNNAGNYCVLVTDALNVTHTYCAMLTVLAPPSITTQPTNRTVSPGSNITFTVVATGSVPLQYQWRLNGANIPDATNSFYTITNAQPRDGGSYSVAVANQVGAMSSAVATFVVTSNALPFADNFATRGTIVGRSGAGLGTNTTATVEVGEPNHAGKTGGKSVWLQWTAPTNGVAVFNTRGSSFDTTLAIYNGSSLATLSNVVSDEDRGGFFTSEVAFNAQAGSNYNIAVDGFFGASGNIVLTWNLDTNLTAIPRIILQPVGATTVPGGNATFTVFAASSSNLTYQWYFNCCLAIAGATNATLVVSNVSVLDVGYYTVDVTVAGGASVRSVQATLELGPDNQLQSQDKFEDLLINGVAGLASDGKGGGKSSLVSVSAGSVSSQTISLSGSTTQSSETNHCGIVGGVSRWLSLKALTNGTFVIDTIGSTIDTVLAVYIGSNLLNLQFVACDNNSAPDGLRSVVHFPATADTTYMVAVDSVGGVAGTIQVNWGIGSAPMLSVMPTNFSKQPGGTITFNVAPTNSSPPPAYQWYLNQVGIIGATNATFTLTNIASTQSGRYTVIVSNFVGSLTSFVAVVNVPPVFVVSGTPQRVNGILQYRVDANASAAAVLQATTNFAVWQPLLTNQAPNTPFTFTDTSASNRPLQFFRVVPAP